MIENPAKEIVRLGKTIGITMVFIISDGIFNHRVIIQNQVVFIAGLSIEEVVEGFVALYGHFFDLNFFKHHQCGIGMLLH